MNVNAENVGIENKKAQSGFGKSKSEKTKILKELKQRGYRITKQRQMILDIILEGDCTSCKEIYYKAAKLDKTIGSATVYRMINTLEEIGVLNRSNMYRVVARKEGDTMGVAAMDQNCVIEFSDHSVLELPPKVWKQIVKKGLVACGYDSRKEICKIGENFVQK